MLTLSKYAHSLNKLSSDLSRREINRFFRITGSSKRLVRAAYRRINKYDLCNDAGYGGIEYYEVMNSIMSELVNNPNTIFFIYG